MIKKKKSARDASTLCSGRLGRARRKAPARPEKATYIRLPNNELGKQDKHGRGQGGIVLRTPYSDVP